MKTKHKAYNINVVEDDDDGYHYNYHYKRTSLILTSCLEVLTKISPILTLTLRY